MAGRVLHDQIPMTQPATEQERQVNRNAEEDNDRQDRVITETHHRRVAVLIRLSPCFSLVRKPAVMRQEFGVHRISLSMQRDALELLVKLGERPADVKKSTRSLPGVCGLICSELDSCPHSPGV